MLAWTIVRPYIQNSAPALERAEQLDEPACQPCPVRSSRRPSYGRAKPLWPPSPMENERGPGWARSGQQTGSDQPS
jgi:hypothetical protein